jgi:hypothetical protein
MSETSMTAVVEYGPGQLKLETISIPAAANGVVIEVKAWQVDLLDNKQIPQAALLNMPVIKKDKVDYYYSQLYVKPQDFLNALPDLIKKNMASGDYASQ